MNEYALIGSNGPVMSHVMTQLLERGEGVNAMTLYPERVMLDNDRLTVSRLDIASKDTMRQALEGYHTAIIANETDLRNDELDNLILKHFAETVNAAREAGVERLVVIGAKESSAFYLGVLNRHNDLDWVFFTTEGDYAHAAVDEALRPRHHREQAMA